MINRRAALAAQIAALMFLTAAAAPSMAGQTPPQAPISTDGFLVLVPLRPVADIETDIAAADAELGRAARAERHATDLRGSTRGSIEAKKQEIIAAKRRRDLAKTNRSEVEVATLDAQLKAMEREKDLLEQRELLGSAEIDLARRSGELSTLEKRALGFERELMVKRHERLAITATGPAASSLDRVILALEQQTLSAQVTQADKKIEVASLARRVADRLLDILAAHRRIVVS